LSSVHSSAGGLRRCDGEFAAIEAAMSLGLITPKLVIDYLSERAVSAKS
jgi:hypothetical protein